MDKLKFILFSVIVLTLLGLASYWAVSTIQSGTEHAITEKLAQLQKENDDLKKEVKSLGDELNIYKPEIKEPIVVPEVIKTPTGISTTEPIKTVVYKNQVLIDELQKLITDKVYMKLKSVGTRVGTIQKFLNIYNKTSNQIDNDYGISTQKAVTVFQKDQGLTADGEAGVGTFSKMIDWLKKQG